MRIFTELADSTDPPGTTDVAEEIESVRVNLSSVRTVLAFASAKGGVGKSVVCANLAAALALKGRKVAIVDADLNSPSAAALLGIRTLHHFAHVGGVEPVGGALGIRLISSDLIADREPPPVSFLDGDAPAAMSNGAPAVELSASRALRKMLGEARFGTLDFVLIDLAPGLEQLHRVMRTVPRARVLLFSHPGLQAVKAVRRIIVLAGASPESIVGIVEDMAGFNCEGCRTVRPLMPEGDLPALARESDVTVLARVPFDPRLAEASDRGSLFVHSHPDTPVAKQMIDLARRLEELVAGPDLRP